MPGAASAASRGWRSSLPLAPPSAMLSRTAPLSTRGSPSRMLMGRTSSRSRGLAGLASGVMWSSRCLVGRWPVAGFGWELPGRRICRCVYGCLHFVTSSKRILWPDDKKETAHFSSNFNTPTCINNAKMCSHK